MTSKNTAPLEQDVNYKRKICIKRVRAKSMLTLNVGPCFFAIYLTKKPAAEHRKAE